MKYVNYCVSVAAIVAECVLFAFGIVEIFGLLLSVIPLSINLVVAIIEEQKSHKRQKKIKVLRRMYELLECLLAYYTDLRIRERNQKRSGWLNPVNPSAEYGKAFQKATPEILEFISLFGLEKQREEILSSFRSTPEKAKLLLNRLETDMKLTDYERLLIKAKT